MPMGKRMHVTVLSIVPARAAILMATVVATRTHVAVPQTALGHAAAIAYVN